jgi:hypothetical protein
MKCIGSKCRYWQDEKWTTYFRCGVDARISETRLFKERECGIEDAIMITESSLIRLKAQKDEIVNQQD